MALEPGRCFGHATPPRPGTLPDLTLRRGTATLQWQLRPEKLLLGG
ncbi:MAG TPA: hypothetical protein VLA61_11970 [Ideonella sp.]|nr:hypothetical protein [Ideonella sp.]HSI48979.1 hypothetical protein [Ideonella sp.]